MKSGDDAFGQALMDWARGGTDPEIYERDDGFIDIGAGHELFLAERPDWPSSERQAMRYVRGRVIDVGCGAGRVALYLQQREFDVVALDSSPLAARVSRMRGVRKTWCTPIESLTKSVGSFDTVVLFGNNFGILGCPNRLRSVLTEWAERMAPGARILAQSTNPYCGGAPALDRSQYLRNKELGLMPGQCRLRVRYRNLATPWFQWLFVSRDEMRLLLRGTGWHVSRILGTTPRDSYVGILEKD
jgi:SAM-dependent methyltransferase